MTTTDWSKVNSTGLANLHGKGTHWNKKKYPPSGSCAFCENKLQVIDKTALCRECKAVYVRQPNDLLNYLGKTNGSR